jgi:hypothetical protein
MTEQPNNNTEYLGDSVYCKTENGMVKLTTNNGWMDTNIIYLEPEVYLALVKFVERQSCLL